jgi:Flp pilus assembly secretin CpaC
MDPVAAARNWESQALLAEADAAFAENRMGDAASKYTRLLDQYNDLLSGDARTRAQSRLTEARIRLGGNPGQAAGVLDSTINTTNAARQSTIAEYENDLQQATAALGRGDTQRARELAASAKVRISGGRAMFSEDEIANFRSRADGMLSQVDAEEARLRTLQIEAQQDANRIAAEEAARQQSMDKNRKLGEAIDRVRALQLEQKYDEALQVVEGQILFLDPINPTGLLLRDVLQDAIIFRKWGAIERERNDSYMHQQFENFEAGIAPKGVVAYPKDWPSISERRGTPIAFAEAEENRRALAVLQSKRIPVDFKEVPFGDLENFLQAVTQLNIDIDWASLEQAGITRDKTVTLKLTNVTIETVLNRIVEKAGADSFGGAAWTISDGVLTIASKDVINKQKVLVIYDIRDLIVEVPDYEDAPIFDLQQAFQQAGQGGRGGGGGGGQSPFRQTGDQEGPERRTLEERTEDLLDIIRAQVDPEGWDAGVGTIQTLGGLLIINNTPANHRAINGLLSKLRETRAMQINVETRFLLVSQDFFEQIGFDLDVYFNANSNVVRTARAARPTTRASDFFDFRGGGFRDTFPQPPSAGANTTRTALPDPLSPIGVGQNSLGLGESLMQTDFSQDIFATSPALGIAGQFLDDIQVDFLIKATQADRRTVSLTAPRLTFTNGQISNITVGTQVQFVADLEPVVSESAVGFDPDPQPINEGVTLKVDGTISADRRYVTMNIDTGVSRIESIQPLAVSAIAGGQLVNSAATQSFIQLPTVTVTRVQTTVTVPDQGTILIGGQRLTTDSEVETGVPVLSKIPVLNRFFTNRVLSKEDSTLMILLKPTILIQSEEEQLNFPGVQDSLLMPFGR